MTSARVFTLADLQRTFTIRINDGVAATLAPATVRATSAVASGVILRFVAEGSESTDALRDGSVDLDIGVGEMTASRRGRVRGPHDDALHAAGRERHVAAVVPTFAAAALLVASSDYVGLVPQRLAELFAATLGLRWFAIAADLPAVDIRLLWHARIDADPTQRWLRETIRAAVG